MAKTLGPGAGLSLRQKQFLEVVLREKYLLENFYLSGGTALSYWYLHHRQSDDLDFFSDRPFSGNRVTDWIKSSQKKLRYQAVSVDEDWGFYTYFFRFPDNSRLKIDFNHYTFFRLQMGVKWNGLQIDSLYDIAVNKMHTIRTHPRERDYVDLYFIIQKTGWQINQLLADADKKFSVTTDILEVSKNLLKISEVTNLPKILVPFDQKSMTNFYLDLAKSLKSQIFA